VSLNFARYAPGIPHNTEPYEVAAYVPLLKKHERLLRLDAGSTPKFIVDYLSIKNPYCKIIVINQALIRFIE
jgi:hypothetical protein